jgi:aldose 1-epimerase
VQSGAQTAVSGRAGGAAAGPSGEQIDIRAGDQRVVVTEVGAGLRSYTVRERALIDGYGEDEMATVGRGQVLIPWPNRIQDGVYEFGGKKHQLPLDDSGGGNAIHGLVRWSAWSVAERDADRVVLEHTLHPQPGYPFSLELGIEYSLSDDGLRVRSTATNVGRDTCPYGSGQHPYLTVGTDTVDTVVLRAPGATVLHGNERGIPVRAEPVEGTEFDFRRPRAIGPTKLDNAYTDLERDADRLARVDLGHPDVGGVLSLWLDESYSYLQLFTGDPLPSVARRSLAVEPMTCPPNAFRTGDSVLVLEPGESTSATWGLQPTNAPQVSERSRPS